MIMIKVYGYYDYHLTSFVLLPTHHAHKTAHDHAAASSPSLLLRDSSYSRLRHEVIYFLTPASSPITFPIYIYIYTERERERMRFDESIMSSTAHNTPVQWVR